MPTLTTILLFFLAWIAAPAASPPRAPCVVLPEEWPEELLMPKRCSYSNSQKTIYKTHAAIRWPTAPGGDKCDRKRKRARMSDARAVELIENQRVDLLRIVDVLPVRFRAEWGVVTCARDTARHGIDTRGANPENPGRSWPFPCLLGTCKTPVGSAL